MTLNDKFSYNLRRLRHEKRLSQEAFAECCGISERYLRKLESGEASPTLQTLDKICDGVEVDASSLLGAGDSESNFG